MRHHSGEGEQARKKGKRANNRAPVSPEPEFSVDDEIDPADFFDPEEFGIRRRNFNAPNS